MDIETGFPDGRGSEQARQGSAARRGKGRRRGSLALLGGAALVAAAAIGNPGASARVVEPLGALSQALRDRLAGEPVMEKPDPVRGVRVMAVAEAATRQLRSFTGVVAARYETALGFRVGGKIESRAVEVGQEVRAGDLLFSLDSADYRAAVSAAEATLAAAQAQAVQTAADEKRQAQLLAQGWTTQAAYDRFKAAAEAAANQARAAADHLVLARNDLSYAELRAPHDGIVTTLRAEAGQVVPVGQPVLTLVRPGDREALVTIPEGQIADIRTWTATASFWGRGGAPEAAVLREVAPQADPGSRTYAVRFSLPESAGSAELGSTVTVQLSRETKGTTATVPATAVLFRDGAPIVWRLDATGDRVQAIPVRVDRLGAETADIGGLSAGDRIVTLGVHRLDEGVRIRVVEGPASPAAAATASTETRSQGGRS
jgi:RND family efflux transporter MFP subunit